MSVAQRVEVPARSPGGNTTQYIPTGRGGGEPNLARSTNRLTTAVGTKSEVSLRSIALATLSH